MKNIKIVFLGAGEISDRFIVQAQKLKNVETAAVYSRNIRNAEFKSQKYGIPRAYDNYNTMLKIEKPDCVIVTTPHSLHAKHTIAALKAGAHVLVEKPMAVNFNEARAMVKASRKYKKFLVALPFDLYPNYLRALDFVREKYIGKILSAHSELSVPGPPRNNWYYNKKVAKGGAVIDVGCYALSRLISILGPVRKVSAFVNMLIPNRLLPNGDRIRPGVDDNAIMILEFEGGVFATVKASWAHTYVENYTVIYGRHGAIYINVDNNPLIVKTGRKIDGKKIAFRNLDNCFVPRKFPGFAPADDIVGRFVGWVREGKVPVYNGEQGLHIMEVMHKAYVSSRTGKVQKLTTPFRMWWPKERRIQDFRAEYI
jgi:predicted dehydrogenase